MSELCTAPENHDDQQGPGSYELRVRGHLDDRWAARFEGMTLRREANGDTLLAGPVVDQGALHSLLRMVRDLGMPLISVTCIKPGQADAEEVIRKESRP